MTLKFKRAQKKVLLCTQFRRGALEQPRWKKISFQNHFIRIKVESASHTHKNQIKLLSPEPT